MKLENIEEKAKRYRIVCLTRDLDKVIKNIKKYNFLKIFFSYEKDVWTNIIVDSEMELNYNFAMRFNKEGDECLGTFEDYEKKYD